VLAYLVVWFGHSTVEYFSLRHEEAVTSQEIEVARARNQVLSKDLSDLHNPQYLKRMVEGKAVTPRPNLNGISASERPS
jgi:cell division protein FtsB